MAARKRKKPVKKVKFQVTRSGIAGIGVVCFCILLWMFLIGVWAGQSLLYPPVDAQSFHAVSNGGSHGEQVLDVIQIEVRKKKKKF